MNNCWWGCFLLLLILSIYLLTPDEDFCVSLLLVFRRIGECISLDLLHFIIFIVLFFANFCLASSFLVHVCLLVVVFFQPFRHGLDYTVRSLPWWRLCLVQCWHRIQKRLLGVPLFQSSGAVNYSPCTKIAPRNVTQSIPILYSIVFLFQKVMSLTVQKECYVVKSLVIVQELCESRGGRPRLGLPS